MWRLLFVLENTCLQVDLHKYKPLVHTWTSTNEHPLTDYCCNLMTRFLTPIKSHLCYVIFFTERTPKVLHILAIKQFKYIRCDKATAISTRQTIQNWCVNILLSFKHNAGPEMYSLECYFFPTRTWSLGTLAVVNTFTGGPHMTPFNV